MSRSRVLLVKGDTLPFGAKRVFKDLDDAFREHDLDAALDLERALVHRDENVSRSLSGLIDLKADFLLSGGNGCFLCRRSFLFRHFISFRLAAFYSRMGRRIPPPLSVPFLWSLLSVARDRVRISRRAGLDPDEIPLVQDLGDLSPLPAYGRSLVQRVGDAGRTELMDDRLKTAAFDLGRAVRALSLVHGEPEMRPILVFFAVLSAVFSSAAIDKEPGLDLKFDQAQEFDRFIYWAQLIISDFNDIDKSLADARAV